MTKEQVYKNRLSNIKAQFEHLGADALLISKPANVYYVSGFLGDDSWALITRRKTFLITDNRYIEQAQQQCLRCKIIERTEPMKKTVAKLLEKYKSVECMAVENSISIAQLKTLRKNIKKRIKPVSNMVEKVRRNKDNSEAKLIIKSAKTASQALGKALRYMKPCVTESALAGAIELEMRKLGAKVSFETIVAFGPNASKPHHSSGKRKLRKNDSVLIDFGAKLGGYCSDMTRCFVIGKSGRLYERAYKAVKQAHAAAIKKIKAGVTLKSIDETAREIIRKHGFEPHGHGTGHGLGLEVHETPIVGPQSKGKLQPGDVITIEPGIYIPGKLGIRIEDDILVTPTGCRILSGGISKCTKVKELSRYWPS
jgi:Xaa-Pro aminopeptidase